VPPPGGDGADRARRSYSDNRWTLTNDDDFPCKSTMPVSR
jgi:hypothetical protein